MKNYETLVDAIKDLRSRGYERDFNLKSAWLECVSMDERFGPADFHVDEVHRFEGMTNPDDSTVLYAIRSHGGIKGLLVDAYGAYASYVSSGMIQKLTIDAMTER